jgi:tripartite-type tricarboxylate transporter receptor subunit TctC
MTESGLANHDAEFFMGVMAPAGTPNSIIELLSGEVAKALADKEIKDRFDAFGLEPIGSTPGGVRRKTARGIAELGQGGSRCGIKVD